MIFPTFEFLFIFFPMVFLLHESRLCRHNVNTQLLLLIIASLIFSSIWELRSFYVIFGMLLANLALLHFLRRHKNRFLFITGILINLLPLAYFKYTAFILGNFGIELSVQQMKVMQIGSLPLAISFYSFVALTYVVDTYYRRIDEHSISKYSFFVTFFPHLIAGPIVHHTDLIPQVGANKDRGAMFYEGCIYLAIGFAKKVLIADPIGSFVDNIYVALKNGEILSFADSLMATLGYTMQIYFDFSGYSDMALGLGLMLGYRLPINFLSPYKAASITDFWRRWHITLSRLMREYIYFNLGGNRKGLLRQMVNLMLTMLISGLWHGAGWTFVLWGGIHGAFMAMERLFNHFFGSMHFRGLRPFQLLFTFCVVNLLWVLFRAENLAAARQVYQGLYNFSSLGKFPLDNLKLLAAALALIALPNSHSIVNYMRPRFAGLQAFMWQTALKSAPGFLMGVVACMGMLAAFYATDIDRKLYAVLPIERYVPGTDNRVGNFRSNLFSSAHFKQQGPKIAIVGSSFTMNMGYLAVEAPGQKPVYSASLGMGGNHLHLGLRLAMAIMDTANLKVIILGISPLNCGPIMGIRDTKPFDGELIEGLQELGFALPAKAYASARPLNLTPLDLCKLFLSKAKFQFREFVFKIATTASITSFNDSNWVKEINFSRYVPKPYMETCSITPYAPAHHPPANLENGNNAKFKWLSRGIHESLEPDGDVYKALHNLNKECQKRGIRLVLYSTPTVSHVDAPHIYPAEFYEQYQQWMLELTRANGIEYYDLSFILPWDQAYMSDFIHPTLKASQFIHEQLIDIVMSRGNPSAKW